MNNQTIKSFVTFSLSSLLAVQLASAADDTWNGNGGNDLWTTAANWQSGAAPNAGDSLFFDGSFQLAADNNLPANTPFDGIFFNPTASQFNLGGNGVLLSGAVSGNSVGITNGSSLTQRISLNLALDWGYYTFSGGSGLLLNKALTPNNGGIAYFENPIVASSLTTDASGLISGLGGAALIANNDGIFGYGYSTSVFNGLAGVSGGVVGPYIYSAGNIISAAGNIGTTTAGNGANLELTSSTAGNYPLPSSSVPTYINTLLLANSTANILVVPSGSGTLDLGTAPNYIGGIYLPNGQGNQGLTVGGGSSCFLTAGPMSGNPTTGEIIFGINGTNSANEAEINATIQDNGSGGPVTVVKTGSGTVENLLGATYTGSTYVDQGIFVANSSSSFGSGPVYVANGAEVYLEAPSGTWANNFFLSPGTGPSYFQLGALRISNGSRTQTVTGTINLLGSPVNSAPGDRVSATGANGIQKFTGQITGTGTLELWGQNSSSATFFTLDNVTANPNNWTGGMLIDGAANNDSTMVNLGANNQLANNNIFVTIGNFYLNLNGHSDQIGGLFGGGYVENSGSSATLTLGAGDVSGTFDGGLYDGGSSKSLSLTKTGLGTQVLDGSFVTYSGMTTVANGKLVVTTAATGAGQYVVQSGASLDVRIATAGSTLKMSSLELEPDSTLQVDDGSAGLSLTTAPIQVTGELTAAGQINIQLSGTQLPIGTFPLISYVPGIYGPTYNLITSPQIIATLSDNGSGLVSVTISSATSSGFASINPMGTAREGQTATLLQNGKVLVAGGENSSFSALPSAELYDPTKGTWTATGSMGTARQGHTAVLLPNGMVLVAGGENSSGAPVPDAELYNPLSGKWSATTPMFEARFQHAAVLLPSGQVLVMGGTGDTTAEIYDPGSGSWSLANSMHVARYPVTATLLSNGKVLVAGGDGQTATLLANGQVLIAGGDASSGATASAELYGVANTPPAISADTSVCAGSTGNTASGPSGAASYGWAISGGTITSGANAQTVTYAAGSADNVLLTLTVPGGANYFSVPVDSLPTASVSGNTTIGAGGSAIIQAVLTGVGPWNVTWSDGVTQNGVTSSPATRSVSPSTTTTYTVTALSDVPCTAAAGGLTGSATVTISSPTIIQEPANQIVCTGDNANFSVTAVGTPPLTYQWQDSSDGVHWNDLSGENSSTLSWPSTLSYNGLLFRVLVADGNDNTIPSSAATLTVNTLPGVSVNSMAICAGSPATLTATTSAAKPAYFWTPGNQTTASITVSPTTTTTYSVMVTDGNTGCDNTGSGTVTVNALPDSAFTVTGGGANGSAVGLSGSESGVNYQLELNGMSVGSTVAGNGNPLNFGNQTAPGTYTVVGVNGTGCSDQMSGSVVVNAALPPVAYNQSVAVPQATATPVTLIGSDPNSPPLPLTYTVKQSPANGTLSGTAPALTYTPGPGFTGSDSFTFTANNTTLASTPATVSINVVPAAQNLNISTGVPAGQTVIVTLPPANGLAGLTATLNNTAAGSQDATVTAETYSSNPETGSFEAGTAFLDLQVLNATIGDSMTVEFAAPGSPPPAQGPRLYYYTALGIWSLVENDMGNAPVGVWDGSANWDFTVTFDNSSTPSLEDLSGTVFALGTPTPPVPGNFSLGAIGGKSAAFPTAKLVAVASSPNGGTLTIPAVNSPSIQSGTVALSPDDQTITYTPANGFFGIDSFTYALSDGFGTAQGTVNVTVGTGNAPSQNVISITPVTTGLVLQFLGIPGQTYVIQSAPSASGPWTDLSGDLAADPTGLISWTIPSPLSSEQFFRTRVGP